MIWLWLIGGALLLVFVATISRRAKRRAAVRELRKHFPAVARQRLVSNFPALDPVLDQLTLRMLFDWMLAQAYCRTNTRGFDDLMRWETEHGSVEMGEMLDGLTSDAVSRLPQPALQVIDSADGGRAFAALLIEHSISEAGARIRLQIGRD